MLRDVKVSSWLKTGNEPREMSGGVVAPAGLSTSETHRCERIASQRMRFYTVGMNIDSTGWVVIFLVVIVVLAMVL